MRGFNRGGKVVLTSTSGQKLKDWREIIYWRAYEECKAQDFALIEGACQVTAVFTLPRPTSRALKYKFPDKKPDLDKLTRALLDGMTGVVYRDDAQVCATNIVKKYPLGEERPGVAVIVMELN
jgi:Holliday junction resolvase RusA-like endonuclease